MVTQREPKRGRKNGRSRVQGRPWTKGRSEVSVYMHDNLLERCNEAWLKSDHRYFSRWVSEKLEEALK